MLLSCEEGLDEFARKADPDYRKVHDDSFIYEDSIEKAFPALSKYYALTEKEKVITGSWYRIDEHRNKNVPTYGVTFYPNHYIRVVCNYYNRHNDGKKHFVGLRGIWELKGSTVYVKLFYIVYEREERKGDQLTTYWIFDKFINLVEFKIMNLDNIDDRGFTKKPFYDFIIPPDLYKVLEKTNDQTEKFEGEYATRSFHSILRNTPADEGDVFSSLPKVEEMAKNGITGQMMMDDLKKYKQYIAPKWVRDQDIIIIP